MSMILQPRKFVAVDPSKCIGCGICEIACTVEKGEGICPIRSRIRVVHMTPVFNFALACRGCKDAKCVKACPEKAISQAEATGMIIVDENKCKGCDWCVQACNHGGIVINAETGKAYACDFCKGDPQCVKACPEEALVIVESDEAADKLFSEALANLPAQVEKLTAAVKTRDFKPYLAEAEKHSEKITEKLQMLNEKTLTKKGK